MKKVAGTLKIAQAQYRELEAFSKFSSDMDPVTAMVLDKGRKNNRLLIQPQYSPMPVGEQIAILYCGIQGLLKNVPLDRVNEFQDRFVEIVKAKYQETILDKLTAGQMNDEIGAAIREAAEKTISELGI
jgi:F-type H+-transporting ATPase subunit alpha